MTIAVRDTATSTSVPTEASVAAPCAVAWIDARNARVARMGTHNDIWTIAVGRGNLDSLAYLHLIVEAIGDCERVLILGPSDARLELEREYVAIYHRPERLVDVEPFQVIDEVGLLERLRQLAG